MKREGRREGRRLKSQLGRGKGGDEERERQFICTRQIRHKCTHVHVRTYIRTCTHSGYMYTQRVYTYVCMRGCKQVHVSEGEINIIIDHITSYGKLTA